MPPRPWLRWWRGRPSVPLAQLPVSMTPGMTRQPRDFWAACTLGPRVSGKGTGGETILTHRTLWSFPWPEPWHLSLRHFRRTHAASPVARDECGRRVTRVPRRAQP